MTQAIERQLTTGQVCLTFNVMPYTLLNLIEQRKLAEPRRAGRFRVWAQGELPAIRLALIAAGKIKKDFPEFPAANVAAHA